MRAMIEDVDNPHVRIFMIRLFRVAVERAKVYEQPLNLPTPEELRYNRAIHKEIHRMSGGKGPYWKANYEAVWNQLKPIAEENLRAKKK